MKKNFILRAQSSKRRSRP